VEGIAIEKLSQATDGAQSPTSANGIGGFGVGSEIDREGGEPRLAEVLVNDLEERPDGFLRHPRVLLGLDAGCRRDDPSHEACG